MDTKVKIKIGINWVLKNLPVILIIGLLIFSFLASLEGIINGIFFGQLVKNDYTNLSSIFKFIGITFLAFILVYISIFIFMLLQQSAIKILNQKLKYKFFLSVFEGSSQNNDINSSELNNLITTVSKQIEQRFFIPIFEILGSIMLGITSAVLVLKTNLILGLIYIFLSFLTFIPSFIGKKKLNLRTEQWTNKNAEMLTTLKDIFKGRFDIINYGVKKVFFAKFYKSLGEQEHKYFKLNRLEFFIQGVAGIISVMVLIAPILIGLIFIYFKLFNVTISSIITISLTADRVVGSIRNISYYQAQIQGSESIRIIDDYSNETIAINNSNNCPSLENNTLVLKNITVIHKNNTLFKNINLQMSNNQKVLITGRSGSGKSTLLKIISRQLRPNDGLVCFNNRALNDQDFAYVSQNIWLIEGSVRDNISLYQKFTDSELIDVLKKVGIYQELGKDVLNIIIKEDGANLSGGQAQRIAVARGILRNRKLFLFDEITSNLDKDNAYKVHELIYSLPAMVIEVAHNYSEELIKKNNIKKYELTENKLKQIKV